MQGIVFVPGISGSELIFKSETPPIWPPNWWDIFGYEEMKEILDPKHVSVGNVIDNVLDVIPIYGTTEQDLRSISNTLNGTASGPYLAAPYDWRIDLRTSVNDLADKIGDFAQSTGVTEIAIVCHSMGGLLTRLLLEWRLTKKTPAWFDKITKALFVCTPHLGAPAALARILGLEWTERVITPSDMKKFAADSHFPAVYQLLPPPGRGILLDTTSNNFLRYDNSNVITAFDLSKHNLNAARMYREALSPSNKPKTVTYTFVYGMGQMTDEVVAVNGLTLENARPRQDDKGDGTVPSWSITEAAAQFTPNIQTRSFPGDHVGVLRTDAFRNFLYSYFGLSGPAPLVKDWAGAVVSLDKPSYAPGEIIHAQIIPDEEANFISGSLMLSRLAADTGRSSVLGVRQQVQFRGGPMPYLVSKLTAPKTPGVYRLDFGGSEASHKTSEEVAGWFVVPGAGSLGRSAKKRR